MKNKDEKIKEEYFLTLKQIPIQKIINIEEE